MYTESYEMQIENPTATNSDNLKYKKQELLWFGLILLVGLLPRLIFITIFPTRPVSDFLNLLYFANQFRDNIFAKSSELWNFLNPGASFIVSIFIRFLPLSPKLVARTLTAICISLLPIFPFLVWKGVFFFCT